MIISKKHVLTGLALLGPGFNLHSAQAVDKSSAAVFIGACAAVGCCWWAKNYQEQQERLAEIKKLDITISNLMYSPIVLSNKKPSLLSLARKLGLEEAEVQARIDKILSAHHEDQGLDEGVVPTPLENVLPQTEPVALRSALIKSDRPYKRQNKKTRFAADYPKKVSNDSIALPGLSQAMSYSWWPSWLSWQTCFKR